MIKEKELDMSMRCIKYLIFVANFMFVLVGFLLISIGTTIKAIYSDFDEFLVDHYANPSKLAIAVGIIIFLVSLFGCLGAIKESVCLVNMYALLMTLVLILEVSISIAAYAMRGSIEENLRKDMTESMEYYETYTNFVWDATQYNLHCCGVYGPDDWKKYENKYDLNYVMRSDFTLNTTPYSPYEYFVPSSCCSGETCNFEARVHTRGCLNQIALIVSEGALLLAVGALCIAFIQVLGIIFAYLLGKSIRRLKTQIQVERTERRQHIYEQFTQGSLNNEKNNPVLYTPSSSEA